MVGPSQASTFRPGAVVLCRSEGDSLVVHRVVAVKRKGNGEGSQVVIRGAAPASRTETVHERDVLGEVSRLRREGRVIRLDKGLWRACAPWIARFPTASGLVVEPRRLPRFLAGTVARRVQGMRLYRACARKILERAVRYSVLPFEHVLWNPTGSMVGPHGEKPLTEESPGIRRNDAANAILFRAELRGRVVGRVEMNRYPRDAACYSDWWLFGLWTHPLVRRVGIGTAMVQRALDEARERRGRRVSASVASTNPQGLAFFRRQGFTTEAFPALESWMRENRGAMETTLVLLSRRLS